MNNFQTLHASALLISTKLIAQLDTEQQAYLQAAIDGGARLTLEVGPLPDANLIQLTLIEREGTRTSVASLHTEPAALQ